MTFNKLESSEIKNKYFYRTEKWDWLTKENIHVFDSKSPRVITMDPWPQKVFLEAIGQLTVSEYVIVVSKEYPKNKIPNDLDKIILEMIESLISEEGIIALSDEPVLLEALILNPLTEEAEVDIKGQWFGSYQYNIPEEFKDEKLKDVQFTLTVQKERDNRFSGEVEDILKSGGTPGVGLIEGEFDEDIVKFRKNMPINARIDGSGKHVIDKTKKQSTIYYDGFFSKNKLTITGTWKFKKRVLIWKGFIPHFVSLGNGTFTMTKQIEK